MKPGNLMKQLSNTNSMFENNDSKITVEESNISSIKICCSTRLESNDNTGDSEGDGAGPIQTHSNGQENLGRRAIMSEAGQYELVQACETNADRNCVHSTEMTAAKSKSTTVTVTKYDNTSSVCLSVSNNNSGECQVNKEGTFLYPFNDKDMLEKDLENPKEKTSPEATEIINEAILVSESTIKQEADIGNFGWFKFFQGVGMVVLFFVNIGTDINLSVRYFRNQMWLYCWPTLGLLVLASLVNCFQGLYWYYLDYTREKQITVELIKQGRKVHITPKGVWFLRILLTMLQCGTVWRRVEYLYYGYMSKNKKDEKLRQMYHSFMLHEHLDLSLLSLIENFVGTAPQLTMQLYIAIDQQPKGNIIETSGWILAIVSSWISLSASVVSYHKSLRGSIDDKANMKLKNVFFYFICRVCEVGGRVLCIAMLGATIGLYTLIALGVHWILMVVCLFYQKTDFYEDKCMEKMFNILRAYVMIFCFLNVKEGQTRFRCLLYYGIVHVEGVVILFLFGVSTGISQWFYPWYLIITLLLFVVHLVSQALYYTCFHPSQNEK